ncbi:MAG: M48 family metalloprotease [Verrucomicrobiales bacterium]
MIAFSLIVLFLMLVLGPFVGSRFVVPEGSLIRLASAPWWEQAEAVFPVRVFNGLLFVGSIPVVIVCSYLHSPDNDSGVSSFAFIGFVVVIIILILAAQCLVARRELMRIYRALGREKSLIRGGRWIIVLIMYGAFFITLIGIAVVPNEWYGKSAAWIGAFWGLLALWQFGGALALLRIVGALQVPPECAVWKRLIADEAIRCGLNPPPAIYELRADGPNAFALTQSYAVALTSGILEFPEDELLSVARHEFGHLTESRGARWVRNLSSLSLVPLLFVGPLGAIIAFPLSLVIPVAVMFILAQLLRRFQLKMELRADVQAAAIGDQQRDEAAVYGRALMRLYEENFIPAVMAGKPRTHPHLYDRLVGLGIDPGFYRPDPPKVWPAKLLAVVWLVVTPLCVIATHALVTAFVR